MKRLVAGFLFLFIAISFLTLARNPLQNDDASLYALAAKNAVVHNQWFVQYITPGDPASFLDKPPLGIWLLAWVPKLAGISEPTIHLPNVIYFCLLLLIMYLGLKRLADEETAFYSTLVASTSLCLVAYSRAPKLDILLTLFVLTAHLSLYAFLKKDNPSYLIPLTLSLACGFLVKSGFGLLLPGLTVISLLIFSSEARQKLFKALVSPHLIVNLLIFAVIIGAALWGQALVLKEQFLPYLKSITIQSKYNTSYVGFGFYTSVVGFLLITIFPWTPLALSSLFRNDRDNSPHLSVGNNKINLQTFCKFWLWSNLLFLFLFYRQNDLRTFTVLVPPLAILAGRELSRLIGESTRKPRQLVPRESRDSVAGFRTSLIWNLFFLFLFSAILIHLFLNPYNAAGFYLGAAILPIFFFTISLALITLFSFRPSLPLWAICFAFVALSYSVLFWNTRPLADAFNPDVKWPQIIKEQRSAGAKFFIYRPPDRQLFFSPDLFYVDFMAGPADKYFWDKAELGKALIKEKTIVLSDTESWKKLKYPGNIVAQDSYSLLAITK